MQQVLRRPGINERGSFCRAVDQVLWICAELDVPVELVPVWNERKSDWFTAINPKQAVPAARDGDLLLHESNTIVAYIATKYGGGAHATAITRVTHPDGTCIETSTGAGGSRLLPPSPEGTAIASMWTEYAETTIAPTQNPVGPAAPRASSLRKRIADFYPARAAALFSAHLLFFAGVRSCFLARCGWGQSLPRRSHLVSVRRSGQAAPQTKNWRDACQVC